MFYVDTTYLHYVSLRLTYLPIFVFNICRVHKRHVSIVRALAIFDLLLNFDSVPIAGKVNTEYLISKP